MRAPTILGGTIEEPPTHQAERGTAVAAILRRRAAAGGLWIEATGPSMGAAIPDGARVLVVPAARPRRGEVWAFCETDGTIVVHRFRRRVGRRLRFQGDATPLVDDVVDSVMLVGLVRQVSVGGRTRHLGRGAHLVSRVRLDLASARRRLRRLTMGRADR